MRAYELASGSESGAHARRPSTGRLLIAICTAAFMNAACQLDVMPRMHGVSAAPGGHDAGPDAAAFGPSGPSGVTALEAGTGDHRDASAGETPVPRDAASATMPEPQLCSQGEQRVTPCGLNGRGERNEICMEGEFAANGSCSDPDACTDEATREVPCGPNGNGSQAQRCASGQWHQEGACNDVDACVNDVTRNVPCGLNGNGLHAQRCTAGTWQESGACSDPDVCIDGETGVGTCGPNGAGTRAQRCTSGQWQNEGDCSDADVCMNGSTRTMPCGVLGGGTRLHLCVSGQWQDDGSCDDPDWTCSLADYAAGNDCDCNCGSRDPDCEVEWHTVLNCGDDEFCSAQGACEDIPEGWDCHPTFYATRDGCDCDCGAYDPDCAVSGQTVIGCSGDEACNSAGVCEDD